MKQIDVEAIIESKIPRYAKFVPSFVVNKLRRIVHEKEINAMLAKHDGETPQEFIRSCFRTWEVTYSIEGLERLDKNGRYIFASNHPFGGMDGMMLADCLIDYFGDVRVVINDLLNEIEPLRPIWLPVNKYGHQNSSYARRFNEEFEGDKPVLTFPAGICSRRIDGTIKDLQWKPSFVKKAAATNRAIVPVFVEGRLSDFFYRLATWRKRLGVKFPLETMWLPDEMFSQKGRHFRIITGNPIYPSQLKEFGSYSQQTEEIRIKSYSLKKML